MANESVVCIATGVTGLNGPASLFVQRNPLDSPLSRLTLQVTLMFTLSRMLHFLLRPFKQPRIISEIISGILVGPSVLSRMDWFKEFFFPDKEKPVVEVLSRFGIMFAAFLIGLKMDPGLLKRSGRKAVVIGLSSIIVPFVSIALTSGVILMAKDKEEKFLYVFSICSVNSLTSFANLVPSLAELKLLNSEIGRVAMSASMTNDIVANVGMIIYTIRNAGKTNELYSFYALMAITVYVFFIVGVIRPAAIWVIERTPPGKPVDEGYIFLFLVIVLATAFVGNMIGGNTFHISLMLGLVIPDGPPLGAALAEKIEAFIHGILVPLYFSRSGMRTNIDSVTNSHDWRFLQLINFMGWLGKVTGTLIPALYYKFPFSDALSLSLFVNSKGIVEIINYNFMYINGIISQQAFTVMILSAVVVTGLSTPMAASIYKPFRRYTVYKRRTVQHSKPDSELRVVTCVHDQAHVSTAIRLLEAMYVSEETPLSIYALHLVELVGRAAPLLIPHKLSRSDSMAHHISRSEHIINAFLMHEKRYQGQVHVHPFTTIAPYVSMHDEVCHLALEKRTSLVLLPFHKKRVLGGSIQVNSRLRAVNHKVLLHAPCSVGIVIDTVTVDTGANTICATPGKFEYSIALFYFGGEDDRESLSIAGRMVANPGVTLDVTRFLPSRSIRENPMERKLDNRLLEQFRRETIGMERVAYREQLVQDMEEIVGVLREYADADYDLVIVGMRHRVNSVVTEGGLMDWSDCPELGVVGDFLASPDFGGKFTILVVKQQDQSDTESFIPDVDEAMHEQEPLSSPPPAALTSGA
ncbi:Cation/H+ exchanger domain-containing protein [Dioscorea alata]|uniref:Cation/H+ exchanger domain-containing protein n=1 Tax=Dioscorea alata TaxID=55571 RepID=A0ACB7VF92_DIOAL|nr:Cation/H+ exchanger domain-containing protein [Dioscorea alata]